MRRPQPIKATKARVSQGKEWIRTSTGLRMISGTGLVVAAQLAIWELLDTSQLPTEEARTQLVTTSVEVGAANLAVTGIVNRVPYFRTHRRAARVAAASAAPMVGIANGFAQHKLGHEVLPSPVVDVTFGEIASMAGPVIIGSLAGAAMVMPGSPKQPHATIPAQPTREHREAMPVPA